MSEPRFSEEEVRRILARAAALQEASGGPADSRAMTLSEVEQAAQEAGIDRALVRRAAAELPVRRRIESEKPSRVGGVPVRVVMTRELSGHLNEGAFPRILDLVQDATGLAGECTSQGTVFAWSPRSSDKKTRAIMVKVSSLDGRIAVRVEENMEELLRQYGGGALAGTAIPGSVFLTMGLLTSAVPLALMGASMIGLFVGIFSIGRVLVRRKIRARALELDRLADDIAAVCRRAALAAPDETSSGSS